MKAGTCPYATRWKSGLPKYMNWPPVALHVYVGGGGCHHTKCTCATCRCGDLLQHSDSALNLRKIRLMDRGKIKNEMIVAVILSALLQDQPMGGGVIIRCLMNFNRESMELDSVSKRTLRILTLLL